MTTGAFFKFYAKERRDEVSFFLRFSVPPCFVCFLTTKTPSPQEFGGCGGDDVQIFLKSTIQLLTELPHPITPAQARVWAKWILRMPAGVYPCINMGGYDRSGRHIHPRLKPHFFALFCLRPHKKRPENFRPFFAAA